jgi:nicotinamide phosphoribosyltransferase
MILNATNITDGYKTGHPAQYAQGTDFVSSNYTPRDFSYAPTASGFRPTHMVYAGLQYAVKEYIIKLWNVSFFQQPKEVVLAKFARRIRNYLGTGQGAATYDMLSRLHDLGYMPIRIKSLPEGSRVNAGIPVFTVTNTIAGFGPLVNYLETVLSNIIWPVCNSASLMEQYYLLAKEYGVATGASEEYWLPIAIHNFALRGHRGIEDGIISAFGHSLFHKGTDTFAVIDFIEDYYNGDSDEEVIGVSVNASEHATVCQNIAVNGGGHFGELATLNGFLTNTYPTGVFSYVADSRDYWDVVGNIVPKLKDIILSRGPNDDGQPGILTLRPDSSIDTPYEVLCGYKVMEIKNHIALYGESAEKFSSEGFNAVLLNGKYYRAEGDFETEYYGLGDEVRRYVVVLGREMCEAEAIGTIQSLWNTFGGEYVLGTEGVNSDNVLIKHKYKLLDSHIRVIYGEAISLQMAKKIYQGLKDMGFSVGNVFFGVGSWAFIGNSSRDSYGIAMKATNSVVNGVDYPLQKDPKGTSSFKKSARGRLRVEFDVDKNEFVLHDDQTVEQENIGCLQDFFVDGKIVNEQVFNEMQARLK